MYIVKIVPIIPLYVLYVGGFQTEEEAWAWVDEHNDPFVDYEVIQLE